MKKKRIWLTGASRGIGLETAKILAKTGSVIFMSASTEQSLKNIKSEFAGYENCYLMPCNVASNDEIKATYTKIKEITDGIDILINNAGVGIFKDFMETSEEEFDRLIDVNLKGPFLCSKAVIPGMITQQSGMIINILSVAAITAFPGSSIYSASKAGLLTVSRILRKEVRNDGIRVIDILPGATESDMWDEKSRKESGHKMMQPEDVARVILNTIELNIEGRLLTEEVLIRPIGGDL